jgi:anti-anti-sigma factor
MLANQSRGPSSTQVSTPTYAIRSSFEFPSASAVARQDQSSDGGADGRTGADPKRREIERSESRPSRLRFTLLQGVIVARLKSAALRDAEDIDDLERELVDLVACSGRQLVLDLGGVSGMSSPLLAVLARVQRKCNTAGGRLALRGVCPELASAAATAGLDQALQIAPDETFAPGGGLSASNPPRPLPTATREVRVYPAAETRPNGDRAAPDGQPRGDRTRRLVEAIDEKIGDWLASLDELTTDLPRGENNSPSGPPGPLAATLRDRTLGHRFLLDVLVLDPYPRRSDADPVLGPIRRILTAMREQKSSRRVVIDLNRFVALSADAAASLADQAVELAVAGGTLRLSNVRPAVMETIRQSRLGRVTKSFATVDEAVLARWD